MLKTLDDIDALKAVWMTGGASQKACPENWQGLDDLSLLAVVGQFSRIATRPTSPDGLALRPEIPPLSLPPLPEALRPQFRRILDGKLTTAEDVVRLIATRGYGVNPIDWMPKRSDANLPPAYDRWRDWLEGNIADYANDLLSAETWDSFPIHSRHRELTKLHGVNPDAARALIATVAPTLAAEQRLRMLECLRYGVSETDKTLLETFASDRSSKVQAFVRIQLARLGHDAVSDHDASGEVADFFDIQRAGMLSRRKIVTARKLKNDAQRKRRRVVLRGLSLKGLSGLLDLSPDDFVDMWDFGGAADEVADIVASSGTDDQVDRFAERAVVNDAVVPDTLMDRISPAHRTTLGLRIMANDTWTLGSTMPWFPRPDGSVALSHIDACKALSELITLTMQNEKPVQDHSIAAALNFLGLIVDRDAAAVLVDRLTAAGVMTVDPRLTLLRLNAAL